MSDETFLKVIIGLFIAIHFIEMLCIKHLVERVMRLEKKN